MIDFLHNIVSYSTRFVKVFLLFVVTVKYNRTPNKKSPISERFHFFALQKLGTFHGINSSK